MNSGDDDGDENGGGICESATSVALVDMGIVVTSLQLRRKQENR